MGLVVGVTTASLAVLRPPGPLADLLLAAHLGLLALGFFLAWRDGLDDLDIRRHLPRVATKGEAVVIVHEVRNRGARLVRDLRLTELHEPVPGQGEPIASGTFFPQVLPRLRAEARTRLFVGQRGRLRLRGLRVQRSDPFGLFLHEGVLELPGELLVRPRPRRVDGLVALERAVQRLAAEAQASDWASVREWRHGDPLRWVHWRLSARRGFPVVRVTGRRGNPSSALLLDRRPSPRARPAAEFEKAVSLTAGLGLAILERGGRLDLLAPGEREPLRLSGLRGRPGMARLLEALALVRPDPRGVEVCPPEEDLSRAVLVCSRPLSAALRRRAALVLETRRVLGGSRPVFVPAVAGQREGTAP